MKTLLQIYVLFISISICSSLDVANKTNAEKICMLPVDEGSCYRRLDMLWYYDHKSHICREFYYGGCGGNANQFATKDGCYAVCYEQLVILHPPQNLTVGYMQHDKIYVYWYQPENFKLHFTNDTATGEPVSDQVATVLPEVSATSSSLKSVKTTAATSPSPTDQTTQNSDNQKNESIVNSDSVTKNTSNTLNVTAGAATIKSTNVTTPGLINSTVTVNSSKGSNSSEHSGAGGEIVTLEGGINLKLRDYIGKNPVPFHFAKLKHYVLSYKKEGEDFTNVTILGNQTESTIDHLEESAVYHIQLTAVYLTNTSVSSPVIIAGTRRDPDKPKECHCDKYGTEGGFKTCNLTISQLPWCKCKQGYSGLFCEICESGFYRTTPSLPCHRCPCDEYSSSGSCYFMDSYLHCSRCNLEYTGQLCHRCGNGYYRDLSSSPALCKKCESCHNIKPGLICDPIKGHCLNCHFNTTGNKCDRCLEGFVGDPLKNISCEPIKSGMNNEEKSFQPPPAGVIAAIVVAIIFGLSVVIGCVVYNRMRTYPAMKPFWTVELKQDHEGVNFSSVPDQDLDNFRDDGEFYEKQSKKSKSQPYSQLKEEI